MDDYAIGVDLGGTNLRAAAVDRTGSILAKITANTQLSAGRDAIVNDIATAIQGVKLQVEHGQLAGVGIEFRATSISPAESFSAARISRTLLDLHFATPSSASLAYRSSSRTTPMRRRLVNSGSARAGALRIWYCSPWGPALAAESLWMERYCTDSWAWPANWGT